jgi:hypothetical protein
MRHTLQLAALTLLTATTAHAQFHIPQLSHKEQKDTREDLSWLAPFAVPAPEGRAGALVHDPRFKTFLRDHLTARQAFWNENQPLPETIMEFLGNPNQVVLDDNRYLAADGGVQAFCPARGLLFVELGTAHPLVVFIAVDWVKEDKTPSQSGAEYTLWLFSNHSFRAAEETHNESEQQTAKLTLRIPTALTSAIARWVAQPVPGSTAHQNITHAVVVEPDGTPHQIPPASIGAAQSSVPTAQDTKPTAQSSTPTQPASPETKK